MKRQIIESITNVINTLNTIDVKGKQNLLNLGGCIHILENSIQQIQMIEDKESTVLREIENEGE